MREVHKLGSEPHRNPVAFPEFQISGEHRPLISLIRITRTHKNKDLRHTTDDEDEVSLRNEFELIARRARRSIRENVVDSQSKEFTPFERNRSYASGKVA